MLTFIDKTIGILAPHLCFACGIEGALICAACLPLLPEIRPQCYRCHATNNGWSTCTRCRKSSLLENVLIRTTYDGFGEQLVKSLKFERAASAAQTIAQSLAEPAMVPNGAVLVPIPTATSRVRERGYDQSVIIAKQLAKITDARCVTMLERYGQQRQTGSTRSQRLAQLENAFRVKPKKAADTTEVILVDDVLTTGATLETAAKVLRQSGIKHISALIFARAE
jgi:ComF family protein